MLRPLPRYSLRGENIFKGSIYSTCGDNNKIWIVLIRLSINNGTKSPLSQDLWLLGHTEEAGLWKDGRRDDMWWAAQESAILKRGHK